MVTFIKGLYESYGFEEKCEELNISKFIIKLQNTKSLAMQNGRKERIFSIDSQNQWEDVIPRTPKMEKNSLVCSLYNSTVISEKPCPLSYPYP